MNFGLVFNSKQKQIKSALLNGGKDAAVETYLELCKGHRLTDAIRYVDKVAAKPNL